MSKDVITIRAFRPLDEPDSYMEYLSGHRRVLSDMGVLTVVRPEDQLSDAKDTVMIVAEHPVLGMVTGIRLQRSTPNGQLPMQKAISSVDPRIHEIIDELSVQGCGEICGLWNSSSFAGRGLPLLLSEAAVSLAHSLHLKHLVCFVASYTMRHALKVGFQLIETIGDGGAFTYPIPRIRSYAMFIPDTVLISTAPDKWRQRVLSLRCRPVQEREEAPTGIPYIVRYFLHVDAHDPDLRIYGRITAAFSQLRA